MSPKNKIKLNLLRKKLDKLDYRLLKTIKIRTEIVKKVINLINELSTLSNFFLKLFNFFCFSGDIFLIGLLYNYYRNNQ